MPDIALARFGTRVLGVHDPFLRDQLNYVISFRGIGGIFSAVRQSFEMIYTLMRILDQVYAYLHTRHTPTPSTTKITSKYPPLSIYEWGWNSEHACEYRPHVAWAFFPTRQDKFPAID